MSTRRRRRRPSGTATLREAIVQDPVVRRQLQDTSPVQRQADYARYEQNRHAYELLIQNGVWYLSPTQFEQAVALLLSGFGWREVEQVGGPGDLGADVIGIDQYGYRTVVQVKQYTASRVGFETARARFRPPSPTRAALIFVG